MTFSRVTEPAVEPVTLADMRAQLRLAGTGEDALLEDLIKAARSHVERETRQAFITQTWRLYLDRWPQGRVVRLPVGPVQAVSSIQIYGQDGQSAALPTDAWTLSRASAPARIKVALGAGLPVGELMAIEIDVIAGYGDEASDVPSPLRQAIRLLAAHWFEHREAGTELAMASLPHGFDRLLSVNRVLQL